MLQKQSQQSKDWKEEHYNQYSGVETKYLINKITLQWDSLAKAQTIMALRQAKANIHWCSNMHKMHLTNRSAVFKWINMIENKWKREWLIQVTTYQKIPHRAQLKGRDHNIWIWQQMRWAPWQWTILPIRALLQHHNRNHTDAVEMETTDVKNKPKLR